MSLNELAQRIHKICVDHGFYEAERNMGEMLMLATSELAEALEEHRSGKPNLYYGEAILSKDAEEDSMGNYTIPGSFIKKPEGLAVELADCIIRCLDTMHSLGVNIDEIVEQKITYNDSRPYKHGRAY